MALQPYERRIGISADQPSVNYSAPNVADAGGAIRGVGKSLLAAAEPIVAKKAQDQAEADAGRAPIVRDENNRLKRAEPLPGGGLRYQEAFKRSANHLYAARIQSDAEHTFEEIRARLADQPQEAWIEMSAHTEAVLETVPPDVRAEIEPLLLREQTQRFNGLAAAKVERDKRVLVDGLETEFRGLLDGALADASALIDAGDFEGASASWAIFEDRFQKNQDRRKEMGVLVPEGEAGEDEALRSKLVPIKVEITAMNGMREIIAKGPELIKDPLQLNLLVEWNKGDQSGGKAKVAGMTFDEYWKKVPDPRFRDSIAAWANKQLADLDRAAAEAAAKEAQAEKDRKNQDVLNGINVLGTAPAATNVEARKAVDAAVNDFILSKAENVTMFMLHGFDGNPTAGRQFAIEQISRQGYMPVAIQHFIEQNAASGNADVVVDFTENMLSNAVGNLGQRQGWAVWRQLPDRTRAIIERNRMLMDQGVDRSLRAAMLANIDSGKIPNRGQVLEAFKDKDGKPSSQLYLQRRAAWVQKVFGREEKDLPGDIKFQIDRALPAYASVYGNDGEAALQAAVSGIAAMWTPSPLGVKGYLPTELAGLNITLPNLDALFGNYHPQAGWRQPGGFSKTDRNGRPTARIELADDTQLLAGAGNYNIYYYDKDGNVIPNATRMGVNIDHNLARYLGGQQQLEQRMRAARIAGAKQRRNFKNKVKEHQMTPSYAAEIGPQL